MRTLAVVGMLLLGATVARPGDPAGLDRVSAYEGTWNLETQSFDTPFSKAGKESTMLRNECWRSAGFYACNQYLNGESKALIVFTYSAKDDTYTTHPIPAGGGAPGSGKLLIKGNTWTFPWEVKKDGKTTYFRVVNVFTSSDAIDYRQEYSSDQEHWTATQTGHETKVAAKT